jgi:hypothetical protein
MVGVLAGQPGQPLLVLVRAEHLRLQTLHFALADAPMLFDTQKWLFEHLFDCSDGMVQ